MSAKIKNNPWIVWITISSLLGANFACLGVNALSRIKDISSFQGVRTNMLVGYGLVAGLNKTGDTSAKNPFTTVSLTSMLERLGVRVERDKIDSNSVAAVIVTATLPPFARNGTHLDVEVSTIGSASSLLGGTLLVTPLLGADGEVYALAQGSIIVGGFTASGAGANGGGAETVTKGVPTTGRIPNGGIVEKEIPYDFNAQSEIQLQLNNPDFTTARRVTTAINEAFLLPIAFPMDAATLKIALPQQFKGKLVDFMTDLEQIEVEPDQGAKVVIDQEAGIIVMGDKVRIDPVAIAQGNLIVEVKETQDVSQPNMFTDVKDATVTTNTDIKIDENNKSRLRLLPPAATLSQLVRGLNALGVGPRDLIIILQSIKAAGALQAELQVI